MAKSTILKQLANNEIDLEVVLSRLLIIASDINNQQLYRWAESELEGYISNDDVPAYRDLGVGRIVYSGINGGFKVKNLPMPITSFSPEERTIISRSPVKDSISAIKNYANSDRDDSIGMDLSGLAPLILERHGIQCMSIQKLFSYNDFVDLLGRIRAKLLSVLISLDKEFGNLDSLDIDASKKSSEKLKEIENTVRGIIFSDNHREY